MQKAKMEPRRLQIRIVVVFGLLGLILLPCGFAFIQFHPIYLTRAINRRLAKVPDYKIRVSRAQIQPLRARLLIDGLRIAKINVKAPAVFFTADRLTLDLVTSRLFYGRLVGDVFIDRPNVTFHMRQRRAGQPRKFGLWQNFFEDLRPFHINVLKIRNGALQLSNKEDIPPTDLYFNGINARATHLTNRPDRKKDVRTRVEGKGTFMGRAPLWMAVEAKPFEDHATFRFQGRLRDFPLSTLNPVLRHYAGVDIEAGTMDVDGTFDAQKGHFEGQVKRVMEGIVIKGRHEKNLGFFQAIKESIFESWAKRQKERGNLDATYGLAGPLGYMDKDIFLAWVWVAKCAFLQSLQPVLPENVKMGPPEKAEEEWMALQARERKNFAHKRP